MDLTFQNFYFCHSDVSEFLFLSRVKRGLLKGHKRSAMELTFRIISITLARRRWCRAAPVVPCQNRPTIGAKETYY
jgi:hypothetical protein